MGLDRSGANRELDCADFAKGAVVLTAFVLVLTGTCVLLTVFLGIIGLVIWIAVAVPLLLGAAMLWHSKATAYRCPECAWEFTIGAWRDLITPHRLDRYRLRCPHCGKVSWMQVLARRKK